ncbi:MAG: AbrB family transcriptional regulator [Hyphomicrobiales bacterium]|nr:AbrB family transcriptional regulator [Hyphomicrobiales bacterium]
MALTRAFKSGNSQAVRIPAELAYDDPSIELTITRLGDVIVIAPARATMKDAIAKLRAAPKPSPPRDREPIEMADRAWD